jgi:hypothetical protein
MRISSQNSQFIFQFPVDFITPYLYDKFQIWLDNMRMQYDNALDYLNSTIKEIVFPSISYENVKQPLYGGKTVEMKSAKNIYDSYQHELDITFRSVDSHTNYFMMQEIMNEYYLNTRKPYIPYFNLSILDKNGDLIYTVLFKNILLKAQGEQRFQYQKQDFGEQTFSITFAYNYLDIIWEIRKSPKEESKNMFDLPLGQGYWERRDKSDWEDISVIPVSKQRKNPIIYPDERPTQGSSQV